MSGFQVFSHFHSFENLIHTILAYHRAVLTTLIYIWSIWSEAGLTFCFYFSLFFLKKKSQNSNIPFRRLKKIALPIALEICSLTWSRRHFDGFLPGMYFLCQHQLRLPGAQDGHKSSVQFTIPLRALVRTLVYCHGPFCVCERARTVPYGPITSHGLLGSQTLGTAGSNDLDIIIWVFLLLTTVQIQYNFKDSPHRKCLTPQRSQAGSAIIETINVGSVFKWFYSIIC